MSLLAPAARPWGTKKPQVELLPRRTQGRARCRPPGPSEAGSLPRNRPARIWPMAMSAWSWQRHRPSSAVPGWAANNQPDLAAWFHPGPAGGGGSRLRLTIHRPGQRICRLWALLVPPASEVGEWAWPFTPELTGQAGGCLGAPPRIQAGCLNSWLRGQRRMNQRKTASSW